MKLKDLLTEKYLGFGNQGRKPIVQEDQQITDAAIQIVEKLISIGIINSWNRKRAEQALDIELSGIRFGGGLDDTEFDSTGIKDIVQEQTDIAVAAMKNGLIKIIKSGIPYYYQLTSKGIKVKVTAIDLIKKTLNYIHPVCLFNCDEVTNLEDKYIAFIKKNIGKDEIPMTFKDGTKVTLVKTKPGA